jgi:hypothetical protein
MKKKNLIQAIIVFIALTTIVFVAVDQTLPPNAVPASAPATEFSAERAIEHLKVIATEPRLVGRSEFKNARDYIINELAELGLNTEIQKTSLGTQKVENVIALIEGTQSQEAILLVAHLDSVGNSPGAMDDGSGVAALLETARALRAGSPLRNSVMLLFTGPEETGGHGAFAFIREHPWVEDIKLVVNFDAGGMTGPVELTSTSPNNGWLIRELAKADPYAYGTSASGEGRTDFSLAFDPSEFSGYDFNHSWDRRTHSAFDNIENLNPATIQHHGYHALSLARHFGNLDSLDDPKDPNPIYFNVLRLGIVHYPVTWVIPIMLVVVLVFTGIVILGFKRKILTLSGIALGALVFVTSLITAPLLVSGLWNWLSSAVPTYQATYFRHAPNEMLLLALFASTTIALTTTWYALIQKIRRASTPNLTIGAYGLFAVATAGFAIAMPEASFLSAWSGLFGFLAVGYWFYSMSDDQESFSMGQVVALVLAAFVAIAVMLPVTIASFMASEANDWFLPIGMIVLLLGVLVPQLQIITKLNKWWLPVSVWATAAILFLTAFLA